MGHGLGSSSCSSRAIDPYVEPNPVDIPSVQDENASEHEQDDSEDDFDELDAAEFESSHGQPVRAGSGNSLLIPHGQQWVEVNSTNRFDNILSSFSLNSASDATLNVVNNSDTNATTTIATSSSLLTDPWHAVERKKKEISVDRPQCIELLFKGFPIVDIHDHNRQGALAIEHSWKTQKSLFHRLGNDIVDSFFCFRHIFRSKHPEETEN
eukprot:scaffold3290_cov165-Ochromonas_danica.AAC.1